MSSELHDQLQATLGQAYRLDRELGGGGMSRVFVAEERALGRTVVVKVLRSEEHTSELQSQCGISYSVLCL